jgi:hypothetical protein
MHFARSTNLQYILEILGWWKAEENNLLKLRDDVKCSNVSSDEKKTAINAGKNTSCKQQNCQYQGRPDYKITQ